MPKVWLEGKLRLVLRCTRNILAYSIIDIRMTLHEHDETVTRTATALRVRMPLAQSAIDRQPDRKKRRRLAAIPLQACLQNRQERLVLSQASLQLQVEKAQI